MVSTFVHGGRWGASSFSRSRLRPVCTRKHTQATFCVAEGTGWATTLTSAQTPAQNGAAALVPPDHATPQKVTSARGNTLKHRPSHDLGNRWHVAAAHLPPSQAYPLVQTARLPPREDTSGTCTAKERKMKSQVLARLGATARATRCMCQAGHESPLQESWGDVRTYASPRAVPHAGGWQAAGRCGREELLHLRRQQGRTFQSKVAEQDAAGQRQW